MAERKIRIGDVVALKTGPHAGQYAVVGRIYEGGSVAIAGPVGAENYEGSWSETAYPGAYERLIPSLAAETVDQAELSDLRKELREKMDWCQRLEGELQEAHRSVSVGSAEVERLQGVIVGLQLDLEKVVKSRAELRASLASTETGRCAAEDALTLARSELDSARGAEKHALSARSRAELLLGNCAGIRPIVVHFARAMEQKLRDNAEKGDNWRQVERQKLVDGLDAEVAELKLELASPRSVPSLAQGEAADVANFAMFLFYRSVK